MRLLLATLLASAAASAAGFTYPDLGAASVGRGATGAAGTGDLSAVAYNPAGLAGLSGLRFQVGLSFAQQPVDFTRSGGCGPSSAPCAAVHNAAPLFLNTLSGASVDLGRFAGALRGLVVAASIYGPPSIGRYQFADPRRLAHDRIAVQAPQRYSLIASDNLILYPGLAAAFRALPWLDVGGTAQLRYFRARQTQSVYGIADVGGDFPDFDAVIAAQATDPARLVFGVGAIAHAGEALSFGASFRPGSPVHASGTLDISVPSVAAAAGLSVTGRRARIDLQLPAEARLGARLRRGALLAELDLVWEGWGTLSEITVTPLDVQLHGGATATQVAPIRIAKRWHGAESLRGGAALDALPWLTLRAGGFYETSAIPDETQQVDFVSLARAGATLGATARFSRLALTAGYAHVFSSHRDVANSTATRTDPYPAPTFVIGNGSYQSSLDVLSTDLSLAL